MLLTIATFTEPWEAHLLRGRLEADGLFAVVAHEHHVWAQWPLAMALGGVKVQVSSCELDAARVVADCCRQGAYLAILEAALGPIERRRCPRCGSIRLRSRRSLPWLLLLFVSVAFTGLIFPLTSSFRRCEDCDATWSER